VLVSLHTFTLHKLVDKFQSLNSADTESLETYTTCCQGL